MNVRTEPGSGRTKHDTPVRVAAVGALALATLLTPSDADACGACYASNNESTIVNDHKMALAVSKQRTILWDQIQYSGNPKNFAYVLPAKPGTRLEPSSDPWFAALDASTRPLIMPPPQSFGGYSGDDDDDGIGCCSSSDDAFSSSTRAGGANSPTKVEVVEQAVVGPYETVTIRSTDSDALQKWLVDHGYAIPPISAPIIATYVQQGYDFIALRLQPSQDQRQIEPIRIVAPGPDLTLPLRLMQIGAGAELGITLYVIAEGRYRSGGNFPEGTIDFEKLIWDYGQNRSNYQELSIRAMGANDGRSFITEYANRPNLDLSFNPRPLPNGNMTGNPSLAAAYKTQCSAAQAKKPPLRPPPPPQEEEDAGGVDAGDIDAGDLDASAADAGELDAGEADAGPPIVRETKCDDLDLALEGLAPGDVWLTRLRGNLPNNALGDTLVLEPATKQEPFDNVHQTKTIGNVATASISPRRTNWRHGTYALIAITALVIARMTRRRSR